MSSLKPLRNRGPLSSSGHVPSLPGDSSNGFPPLHEPLSAPLPSQRDPLPHSRQSQDRDDYTDSHRHDTYDETIQQPPRTAPVTRTPSDSQQLLHAIETPRPTLMFAIASDDVEQVRQVLQSGEVDPNEAVGPQSALAFTLTNSKLTNKLELVKMLLAYGADPESVRRTESLGDEVGDKAGEEKNDETMDHATR